MAIAIDATADGFQAAGTTLTYSHTCTGSNRALLVGLYAWNGSFTISGITYNGVSMTKLIGRGADGSSGTVETWGLANPSTGANNIVITATASGQIFGCSASYTGVDQTTPFPDTETSGTGLSASWSTSITTSVDQSWVFSTGRSPSKAPSASAGTYLRKTNGASGDAGWLLDSNGARSTGSNTLDYTWSGSSTNYWTMTSIAPSSGSVAAYQRRSNLSLLGVS